MKFVLFASVILGAQSTITTWTLAEYSGVTHPEQPVCFPYTGSVLTRENNRVLGPASTEVAWQQLSDRSVCVSAGLAADDAGDVYTLQSGAPTTVTSTNPPRLTISGSNWQLFNGITGARLPTKAAQDAASPARSMAPIQAVYVGGDWEGTPSKLLTTADGDQGAAKTTDLSLCSSLSQAISEIGDVQISIVTEMVCSRPQYYYGVTVFRAAGTGLIRFTVSLAANSNSVVLSYFTDMDIKWSLDLTAAYSVVPNLLAWRGQGTASISCGYYLVGGVTPTIYPAAHDRGERTALKDLTYASNLLPTYFGTCTGRNPAMVGNYMAGAGNDNAFVQWLLNDGEDGSYPVVGLWTGAGDKNRYRMHDVGFATTSADQISIAHNIRLRGADGSWVSYNGLEIGYHFNTQANFPDKTEYGVRPPILTDMNKFSGPSRLTLLYANTLDYDDPAGGWEWPFLADATMVDYVERINTDTNYFNALIASNPGNEGTRFVNWARFQDDTRREAILSAIRTEVDTMTGRHVLGDGRFDVTYQYYQALYPFVRNIDNLVAVIKDPGASAAQIVEAKRYLGMGVYLSNSNAFFNYDLNPPDGLGLPNQAYQLVLFRDLMAIVMNEHPAVTTEILTRSTGDISPLLSNNWNSTGAGRASTHYQSNYAEPASALLNVAVKRGLATASPFTSLKSSINWDLSSLTPQEPRFINRRKSYSNGDGNTEAQTRLGLLGTVFNSVDATLSQKALWGWRSQDPSTRYTHGSFYFPTVAMIDDQITQTDPAVGSLYMTGYHAALRSAWETSNETALWHIHGGFYDDHKHRDNGQVSIYAHRAPLAVDWNANLYSPQTAGGYMHSRAVKESQLADTWDAAMTGYGNPDSEWGTAASVEFGKFNYSSLSKATYGSTWVRDIRLVHHSTYPIIFVRDSFSGADTSVSKVVSWAQMATGSVTVNGGGVTPTTRNYDSGQTPSCTASAALNSGLNRLQFTGQSWTAHATSGIDWDTYINVTSAASYCLGNWSHIEHASREKAEYLATNGGAFRERQHILRVKTSDAALETVILPWRKGESATFTVTSESCGTQVVRSTHTTCSGANGITWTDGTNFSLAATGSASISYQNMTISGGPAEVRTSGSDYVVTVDGLTAANRTITLPSGTWYPSAPAVRLATNQYKVFHDGTANTARAVTFATSGTLKSINLGFSAPAGGDSVRILVDGVAVAQESCSTTCSVTVTVPTGAYSVKNYWIDAGGEIILESAARSMTAN